MPERQAVSGKGFEIVGDNGSAVQCEKLILACGGKTYPALGSDGSGFALATSLDIMSCRSCRQRCLSWPKMPYPRKHRE